MESQVAHIHEQFLHILTGTPWYGPSVKEILTGINAERAAHRPLSHAHTIWEILVHMTVWTDIARGRLDSLAIEPTAEEDWPPILDQSPATWEATVNTFIAAWRALSKKVTSLPDDHLAAPVSGKSYSAYFMLQGVIQHTVYHAGQIALLKKEG